MASDAKSETAYKALLKTSKNKKHHQLNKFLKETEIISIDSRRNKNLSLKFFIIKTIIGQQVSIGAAASIWKKTEKLLNHKKRISWNPFQKRETEITLEQEQLEQLAGFLNKHTTNGYPSSLNNIDFGTFME